MRIAATAADLPPAVAAALANPTGGTPGTVAAGAVHWPTLAWGNPADAPVLLIHGVTSNAGIWWRVGPAVAAAGRHVIALDMPGHGSQAPGAHSHRFIDTAAQVVAFVRAAGLDRPDLAVVGHSWGGMVTAHLPMAGLAEWSILAKATHATLEEATAAVRAENPGWSDGDVAAKAQALTEFNPQLVLDVLLKNGDWDAGMAALRDTAARGVDVWLIRGEWATGSFIPESRVARIEAQLGADHVLTIEGGPHSPQRTHPEATVLALLRALA